MHQDLILLIPTERSCDDGHRLGVPAAWLWFLQARHAWGTRLTSKRWVMLQPGRLLPPHLAWVSERLLWVLRLGQAS